MKSALIVLIGLLLVAAVNAALSSPAAAQKKPTIAATDTVIAKTVLVARLNALVQSRQQIKAQYEDAIKKLDAEILVFQGMAQGQQLTRDSLVTVEKRILQD